MATSRFELTGRFLAGIAAASLLAGVSGDASAFGDKGVINLRLGQGTADGFYLKLNRPGGGFDSYAQYFNVPKKTKCIVDLNAWGSEIPGSGPPKIVGVQAHGPYPQVGLVTGSLGVFDNSNGTSCGSMSVGEELVFDSLKGGFDRLELDMELKGNAIFELTINPGSATEHTYWLYSGTNQQPGKEGVVKDGAMNPASYPAGWMTGDALPASAERNCAGASDSGPDSGPSDNCRWVINDVGGSFRLRPTHGEGSLEGGGDYVGSALPTGSTTADTLIYLTTLIDVGTLSCSGSADPDNRTAMVYSPTDDAAQCMVTRIRTPPYSESGGACDYLLNYKLETFSFDSLCSLDKTAWVNKSTGAVLPAASNHKQVAGANQVTFLVEDRTVWDIEQTYMTFTKLDGSQTADYYLSRCGGTVVRVGPDGSETSTPRETTIREVLAGSASDPNDGLEGYMDGGRFVAGPPDDGYTDDQPMVHLWDGDWELDGTPIPGNDAVPNNGVIDWACILDNTETYVGDDEMYVTQHILFWGDAYFGRN